MIRAALADGELSISSYRSSTSGQANGVLPDLVAAVGGRLRVSHSDLEVVIPSA